jgi:hypothetical protein
MNKKCDLLQHQSSTQSLITLYGCFPAIKDGESCEADQGLNSGNQKFAAADDFRLFK